VSQQAVREFDAKRMLFQYARAHAEEARACMGDLSGNLVAELVLSSGSECSAAHLVGKYAWLGGSDVRVVAKPDQLVKRRGKHGLVLVGKSVADAVDWIKLKATQDTTIDGLTGRFDHFVVEPFVAHRDADEFYVCVYSVREGDVVLFYEHGGVEVGDVDAKAHRLLVPTGDDVSADVIVAALLAHVPAAQQRVVASFVRLLLRFYNEYNLGYVEINPFVVVDGVVRVLDMAAKVDETAHFESAEQWGALSFPSPFGKQMLPEERYIHELDSKTGASLKLTILNPSGLVWTMVAGGGASVIYADTVVDLGFGHELANYGEYSGDPSETLTFEYANTILTLMTRDERAGKVLLIGGGIANFTNVADTFKGIARALEKHAQMLRARGVRVFVRRGGPNYQEGLQMMKLLGLRLQVPLDVYGPETHLTKICSLALFPDKFPPQSETHRVPPAVAATTEMLSPSASPAPTAASASASAAAGASSSSSSSSSSSHAKGAAAAAADQSLKPYEITNRYSRAIVYGMQPRAVQGMLDFDHICGRSVPSVVAMVFPFSGNHMQKFYWGANEVVVPVYEKLEEACRKHPAASVLVNFASHRSVYETVDEALNQPQLRTIAIIAEGVPERRTRLLIAKAKRAGVIIVGPATVGGIKAGAFRIGNTGGMLDNVIASRLYRPGSIGYVSRSGGLSNELNSICARVADGIYEGVAIGGDRFPGSTFSDHVFRYQDDPNVKLIVLLGEVGGEEEYTIADAIRSGRITKPLVAWCIGTSAKVFRHDVQFGHAGALALNARQTADAKNTYLRAAGAHVPSSFEQFDELIGSVYLQLVKAGTIVQRPEPPVPSIPMDYSWAQKLGLVRKPTSFMSSISDDRGDELLYAGMPLSQVFRENLGVGGVVSLLWFQRRLPDYASKFIEMILVVTADHGPAVSGAHNTIVAARAGKDIVSSLCSGLLTIGPRFGGASDEAARQFTEAHDTNLTPKEFIEKMRRKGELIMGIGHKVRSATNPDMRVTILKKFVKDHFPATPLLDYALEVEKLTTAKRANLILNVDGTIAVAFVDLMRNCGAFTREESDEYIKIGVLNALFILGRSIGFMGHFIDQSKLKQGLYRHDTADIAYISSATAMADMAESRR
jgi:ATP citrate (pro-S)-lyase